MTTAITLATLRRRIETLERSGPSLPARAEPSAAVASFGLPALDERFAGGGLAHGVHQFAGEAAAVFALLMLARRVRKSEGVQALVVQERAAVLESGELYGPGLHALGLDPSAIALVSAKDAAQTLRIVDEALRSGAVKAVVAELNRGGDRLDLAMTQRFNVSAQQSNCIGFLVTLSLDHTSAALTRWRVSPAPSAAPRRWVGPPTFHLELTRNRLGRPGRWTVEWSADDHGFRLAATVPAPVARTPVHRQAAAASARPRLLSPALGADGGGQDRFAAAGGG